MRDKIPNPKPNRAKGFTLLEVLLTIILMTSGFLALLQAISTTFFVGADNENMLLALNLAEEKMEEIRNEAYPDIGAEAKEAVSDFPAFQREVVLATPQSGLKQVDVNVYWLVKSDEMNVGLVTYISDI